MDTVESIQIVKCPKNVSANSPDIVFHEDFGMRKVDKGCVDYNETTISKSTYINPQ